MTEQEKIKIFEQAKSKGFYGGIWGSFDPDYIKTADFRWDINYIEPKVLHSLELVHYSKDYDGEGNIACMAIPSVYSGEGYLYLWYFDSYGKSWALTKEELKDYLNQLP